MTSNLIQGLQIFEGKAFSDSRGKFARLFDAEWFPQSSFRTTQINISINPIEGTLRGMHYQISGEPENKLITLIQGSVFLVVADLRKSSSTYLKIRSQYISAEDSESILVPAGCATGWLSTSTDVQIHYVMSSRFEENTYSGFKYNDPAFDIPWPNSPVLISEQDNSWLPYQENN